jgi:hypothetical protein
VLRFQQAFQIDIQYKYVLYVNLLLGRVLWTHKKTALKLIFSQQIIVVLARFERYGILSFKAALELSRAFRFNFENELEARSLDPKKIVFRKP